MGLIEKILKPARKFEFWTNDEEFYQVAAKTPRSNCVLDVSKLLATGVKIRGVEEALEDSLKNWKPEMRTDDHNGHRFFSNDMKFAFICFHL